MKGPNVGGNVMVLVFSVISLEINIHSTSYQIYYADTRDEQLDRKWGVVQRGFGELGQSQSAMRLLATMRNN